MNASAQPLLDFDGPCYDPAKDQARLTGQAHRVFNLMADGRWRSLSEISLATGDHEASVSSQLRHFRKPRFGAHQVEKRRRGDEPRGLWEYRLIVNNTKETSCQSS